jgi:hypothetical protein
VFALLLGLLAERVVNFLDESTGEASFSRGSRSWIRLVCAAALVVVAVECSRWLSRPVITLDGRVIEDSLSYPALDYQERRLEVD